MKRIAYMTMVVVAALAIVGCHCKDKCCGTCKGAAKAAKCECATGGKCCGTCKAPADAAKCECATGGKCCGSCGAKHATEKPKDHPAH